MKVFGVDPSSSASGIAVVEDGQPLHVETFLPSALAHKDDWTVFGDNLVAFGIRLDGLMIACGPVEHVVCEKVSVSYNPNTIRKIAYYESVVMCVVSNYSDATGEDVGLTLLQATSARRKVLGSGSLSKEAARECLMSSWYPEHGNPSVVPQNDDESDALIMALSHGLE